MTDEDRAALLDAAEALKDYARHITDVSSGYARERAQNIYAHAQNVERIARGREQDG